MCLLEKVIYENLLLIFSFYVILLYNVIDDVICIIYADAMFNLYDVDIENL